MIAKAVGAVHQHLDLGNVLAGTTGGSFGLGIALTVAEVNERLQAGAFIVTILVGISTILYHWFGKRSK